MGKVCCPEGRWQAETQHNQHPTGAKQRNSPATTREKSPLGNSWGAQHQLFCETVTPGSPEEEGELPLIRGKRLSFPINSVGSLPRMGRTVGTTWQAKVRALTQGADALQPEERKGPSLPQPRKQLPGHC